MRSMLFVPGDSPRKFEKASAGNADVVGRLVERKDEPGVLFLVQVGEQRRRRWQVARFARPRRRA